MEQRQINGREQKRRSLGKGRIWMALVLALALVSGLALALPSSADSTDVKIQLDGRILSWDTAEYGAAFIDENSRTQVPLNAVMTAFGAEVSWNAEERTAVVEKDDVRVEVPIGERYILKNGERIEHDTTAVIIKQRTYLPIAVVLKAFGASVEWDGANRTVLIVSDGSEGGDQTGNGGSSQGEDEMKAMWISYLEFAEMPKGQAAFQKAVDQMFDGCVSYGMNAVIVQVRPDSDAMYPSRYFPWSKFASGTQGVDPGYDPLEYMIEAAHARELEFHAWINPYRITGYLMPWSEVSSDHPAKAWVGENAPDNGRRVLLHNGFYYYNPSIPEVRELVVNGVKEIIEQYDVDGIHFDDYFYPSLNDSDSQLWFDKPEYDASGTSMSIADWRRNQVNLLVQQVYEAVKAEDENLVFGISPAGNLSNLRSNSNHFVDIDRWMTEEGYVDYIMPQLYWGFERRTASGDIAPYAYQNNLESWVQLAKKGTVTLYIGLNVDNAGKDVSDNNTVSEWLRYDDILKRQVEAGRATGQVGGYAFFRYDIFRIDRTQKEIQNLMTVLKN